MPMGQARPDRVASTQGSRMQGADWLAVVAPATQIGKHRLQSNAQDFTKRDRSSSRGDLAGWRNPSMPNRSQPTKGQRGTGAPQSMKRLSFPSLNWATNSFPKRGSWDLTKRYSTLDVAPACSPRAMPGS